MNKTLQTRIQSKYDTYTNWTTQNPTPLAGEICVVTVPAASGAVAQEPAILFKVGDGTTDFNSLPFVSAVSADVYDWAKASIKPVYTASEISGLSDFISGEIEDTDTQYNLEVDESDPHKIHLYKKGTGEEDWTLQATITTADTVYDDTELSGRVTSVESAITTLNGDGDGSVNKKVADAVAQIVSDAPEAYDTLKEISDWISSHAGSAAEMNSAIQDLEDLIGTLPEEAASETVVAYITEAVNAMGATKVDKVEGSRLMTNEEGTKLAGIEAGAEENTIEVIKVNGSPLTVSETDDSVDITVPTGALADKDKVLYADLDTTAVTTLQGMFADKTTTETTLSGLKAIASSGNVNDLVQTEGEYLILNCGSASVNI